MTAPFAPRPSRPMIAVVVAMLAVAVAIPFARRDDWVGRIAVLTVAAANVVLWGLLIWGAFRRRRKPPPPE